MSTEMKVHVSFTTLNVPFVFLQVFPDVAENPSERACPGQRLSYWTEDPYMILPECFGDEQSVVLRIPLSRALILRDELDWSLRHPRAEPGLLATMIEGREEDLRRNNADGWISTDGLNNIPLVCLTNQSALLPERITQLESCPTIELDARPQPTIYDDLLYSIEYHPNDVFAPMNPNGLIFSRYTTPVFCKSVKGWMYLRRKLAKP